MKTYDPRKYTAVFAGVNLNRGLADGTWIKIDHPPRKDVRRRVDRRGPGDRVDRGIHQVNLVGTVTV